MTKWLIIDGYNLIYRIGDYRSGASFLRWVGAPRDLAGKRRGLVQLLEKTVGILAERITVVFDGRSGGGPARSAKHSVAGGPDEQESTVVEVLFSPGDKTADTVIEQLVFQAGPAGGVVVVTSDRLERETTEAAGAETKAGSVFLDQLNETLVRIEQSLRARNAAQRPATPLGNPFSGLVLGQQDQPP
jgi:predicted RNA-binding protein with PIN domain